MAFKSPRLGSGQDLAVLAATVVAALTVLLALANMLTAHGNTGLMTQVRERQQVINQGVQLSPLNVELSQLIGRLVVQSGDIDLRAVLERHNVSINASIGEAAAAGRTGAAPKP